MVTSTSPPVNGWTVRISVLSVRSVTVFSTEEGVLIGSDDSDADYGGGLKDTKESLGQRFNRRSVSRSLSDADDGELGAPDASDTNIAPDAHDAGDTSDAHNTGNSEEETDDEEGAVRDRKQVAMYLPAGLREELNEKYEKLDARSKLDDKGGIEKHREFYERLVRCALESPELERYVREQGER